MRFLLVYDCIYPESLGGVEHRNHCLAQALVECGHTVTIAGWVKNPHTPSHGVKILPLAYSTTIHDGTGQRSALTSLWFAAAAARLNVTAYDVIETANIPYVHILPLALRCLWARKPLIVTWYEFFGSYWSQYKNPVSGHFYRAIEWLCAQIGHVNATSPLTGNRLSAARTRSGRCPISIIPCGVWLRDIQLAMLAPARDAPPLLYAGRLIPEKRIDLLLHAVAKLNRTSSRARSILLGVVGDGPDRSRLEAMATSLDITDCVTFYGRIPDIMDMWRLLAGARIAVQPSAREGFGLFPLEAMSLGRPVVICESADSAVGDVVRNGVEGLCTAASPEALAEGLASLLDDNELWSRMSSNAAHRASFYDWRSNAERIEGFVRDHLVDQPQGDAQAHRDWKCPQPGAKGRP